MFKIGEFSALARVSVKTLRYYDELGLLRPFESTPSLGTASIPPASFHACIAL
ncbi:MAG: MerR family DNA-binding transcriptional regulator [Acidobacteriia bacterium]|nr:MerR family DNA-binding transcriptional regulator [Terriglobia bacterium]MBV9745064.1 MerR family DNA-binding transcriptional regulator [Terriglobia bacterium]